MAALLGYLIIDELVVPVSSEPSVGPYVPEPVAVLVGNWKGVRGSFSNSAKIG